MLELCEDDTTKVASEDIVKEDPELTSKKDDKKSLTSS